MVSLEMVTVLYSQSASSKPRVETTFSRFGTGSGGILELPAYYDHYSGDAMERLMRGCGFGIFGTRGRYHQASYFGFFARLYLASTFYETIIGQSGRRHFTGNVLIIARKSSN